MKTQLSVREPEATVEVLSCKWTSLVVQRLAEGLRRPAELRRSIPGLSVKVLYERLHRLQKLGLVQSQVFDGYPRHVEYQLTPQGQRVLQVVQAWHTAGPRPEVVSEVMKCYWLRDILEILQAGPHRPHQIKRRLGEISNKVLAEKLRKLERLQLICRQVSPGRPLAVWYELTPEGERLSLLLTTLGQTFSEPLGQGVTSRALGATT